MPACGTDALHAARVGRRGGRTVHHRIPVVKVAISGHVALIIVWSITVGRNMIIRGCYAGRNRRAVGVVRGAQVFLHPALAANLHRIVSVVVVVCHGSGTWTRLTVEKSGCAEIQYDGLRLILCLRDHLAFEFLSRNHSITFVNHGISVGERMVNVSLGL